MTLDLKAEKKIDWMTPPGCPAGFQTIQVCAGRSDGSGPAIELAVARWSGHDRLTREALAKLHSLRLNRRATPVVLVIELDDGSVITFGPNAEAAPLKPLPIEQAQRLYQSVLDEPTALHARARLAALTNALDSTAIPGVKNSGLFANHELRTGVPQRSDWQSACKASTPLLAERGQSLISKLGYSVSRAGAHALVLTGLGERPQAIAVMLDEREAFDSESPRFSISPVAYGLTMAERQGVPWLIVARGSQLRLYPARVDMGVGRKGLAETFVEVDLPYLASNNAGYLTLLFSAAALAEDGTTFQIMAASAQYAVALGERLRDKVYEEIIPDLSLAVAEQMVGLGYEMDADGLDLAYQITLRVFFRLLFQVYAEDRKLLPYKENDKYTRHALKTVAQDMVDNPEEEFDPESTTLWDDLAQVWRVIDGGDKSWGVPPYNGGLFASDPELNPHGVLISQLRVTNDVMGPVLRALLLDDGDEGQPGPIDFRSLSVREFGTIYEGLLESSLGLAEVDLTLDDKGTWLPAKKKSDVIYAEAGQVYFHNTSGQRKGTGSYFTPSFVVEHLLERSLDPALDDHLERVAELIKKGDQAGAADLFFDFKVADLAMGSGHFLTAAIDHIEAKMAAFLAEDGNQIPGVAKELTLLFKAAKDAIGPDAPEPEPSSLLRRQIARRCIYGLDINPIAVELARVSIWIHTFVRGLPMSSLDHNLVCANSLTGIGSVEEALDVLVPGRKGERTLFDAPIEAALQSARAVLVDVAKLPELNRAESQAASQAVRRAQREANRARLLFDAAILRRIGQHDLASGLDPDSIARTAASRSAQSVLQPLNPAHMPLLFPEVFLRKKAGFDVLVGNPPWEEIQVKEHKWWSLRFPGIRSLSGPEYQTWLSNTRRQRPDLVASYEAEVKSVDYAREILASGPFPGLKSGSVDLYKAFAWRNLQVINSQGRLGLLMPRGLFASTGSELFRKALFTQASASIGPLVNTRKWLFDVQPQYTVVLMMVNMGGSSESHMLTNVCHSVEELRAAEAASISMKDLQSWSPLLTVPLLSGAHDLDVMRQMYRQPRLKELLSSFNDGGLRTGVPMNKLHRSGAQTQDFEGSIRILKGGSFDLWNHELRPAEYFISAEAIPDRRRITLSSQFFLAFRQISRATDSRTIRIALIPPGNTTTDGAPIVDVGDGGDLALGFLHGVLSSRIFDWVARRWVEVNVNQWVLETLPVPDVSGSQFSTQIAWAAAGLLAPQPAFSGWLARMNFSPAESRRESADLESFLEAQVAHAYGLSRAQVGHIFRTFHRGWNYQPHLDAVLSHFDQIRGDS